MTPDKKNSPPTAQSEIGSTEGNEDWLILARAAYRASTTYVDNNLRKQWDDGIRAFNSQHSTDSKYNQPAYEKRSHLYRPKTRAVIRKNEAAAATAFFSSMDVVSISPSDQGNKMEVASSEVMKELLQYRLTKSVPWFQVVLGGLQDAQTTGASCAHIYWDYKEKPKEMVVSIEIESHEKPEEEYPEQEQVPENAMVAMGETAPMNQNTLPPPMQPPVQPQQPQQPVMSAIGQPTMAQPQQQVKNDALVDKPCIDLIPIENIRIDPSASWTDPINSSPYVIHLMPMYVMDIKEKMNVGEWMRYDDGEIRAAIAGTFDSTRSSRHKDRTDPYDSTGKDVIDYEICWIQRHIHRRDGIDWDFYTLGDIGLLTCPEKLSNTVFHGVRPYVMGCCILESHKIYPASIPSLGKGLQDEANEVVNQRIDNIKFVLNKKWFVKRGRDADVSGLLRNVPGGVVMMEDPQNDVREVTWPDVTQSAYEEQSRIDNDLNDLLGNFSPAQVMADKGLNAPARNMSMLSQSSGTLVEYMLRTYVETFVQPILRQLVKLEQAYETDQVILSLAAKKAQLFQKYGIDEVTDQILDNELTLSVNVGMGATDPQMKLQKFTVAMSQFVAMFKEVIPGINMQEVGKEIFGHLGYQDGARFFTTDNPQVLQLQTQLQQAQQVINQLNMKLADKQTAHQVKLEAARMTAGVKLQTARMHEDNENLRNSVTHLRALREENSRNMHDAVMSAVKHQQEVGKTVLNRQTRMNETTNG